MDLLRNLFGNVTSGIIRLAVTAGVLFLCYLFLVKPVLQTTDKVFRESGFDEISKSLSGVGAEIRKQVDNSLKATRGQGNHRKLLRCIKHADQDVVKLRRCVRRY